MAQFDELMERAVTVRNNVAPSSNTAVLVGGVLVSIVSALQMLLDNKQGKLTFDNAPQEDSLNPVTSDGIWRVLQEIDLSVCEMIVNKVTSINEESTDTQYPTAKLLYDTIQELAQVYAAISHTHAIADVTDLQSSLDGKANQSTTYTKTEVDNLIAAIRTLSFEVVQTLPTSDIQTNVIYLVPSSTAATNNVYDEYIYVNNNWECIGSTQIDLSVCEMIANKVTSINEESTDTEYPSAKCVYDAIQAGGGGGGQPTEKQATLFFSSSMLAKTMPNALAEFTITTMQAVNVETAYYSLSSGATHQLLTFVNGSIDELEIVVPAGGWIRFEDITRTDDTADAAIAVRCGGIPAADKQVTVYLNEALEAKVIPNALGQYTITEMQAVNVSLAYYSVSNGASHQLLTFVNGKVTGLNITVPAGGWFRLEDVGRTVYNSEASIGIKYNQ